MRQGGGEMEGKQETFIVKSIYRYRTQETTTEKTSFSFAFFGPEF